MNNVSMKQAGELASKILVEMEIAESAAWDAAYERLHIQQDRPVMVRKGAYINTVTGEGGLCETADGRPRYLGLRGDDPIAYTQLECIESRMVNGERLYRVIVDDVPEPVWISEELALVHFGTDYYTPTFRIIPGTQFEVKAAGQSLMVTIEEGLTAAQAALTRPQEYWQQGFTYTLRGLKWWQPVYRIALGRMPIGYIGEADALLKLRGTCHAITKFTTYPFTHVYLKLCGSDVQIPVTGEKGELLDQRFQKVIDAFDETLPKNTPLQQWSPIRISAGSDRRYASIREIKHRYHGEWQGQLVGGTWMRLQVGRMTSELKPQKEVEKILGW